MFRTFRFVIAAAIVLYAAQWVIAYVSASTGADSSAPRIPYPEISLDAAGAAVTLLITSAIAVQVFLRLPRDPERFSRNDVVAHHQFWAPVATLIAVGSAFLIVYTFVDGVISSLNSGVLDLAQVIGIPLVSVVALVFASDAVSLSIAEMQDEQYVAKRREIESTALQQTIDGVQGTPRKHPRRSFVGSSILIGGVFVVGGTVAAWALLEQSDTTIAFAILSTLATAGLVVVSASAVTSALRGKVLESIFQILLPALAIVVLSLQSVIIALPTVSDPDVPHSYLPAFVYGVLVSVPPFATVSVLALARVPRQTAAPLLDFARHQLSALKDRVEKHTTERTDRETWELLMGAAILLSPIPFVSVFLGAAATWHRRQSLRKKRSLLILGWLIPVVVTLGEIAALVLLPVYGVALGWFTTM